MRGGPGCIEIADGHGQASGGHGEEADVPQRVPVPAGEAEGIGTLKSENQAGFPMLDAFPTDHESHKRPATRRSTGGCLRGACLRGARDRLANLVTMAAFIAIATPEAGGALFDDGRQLSALIGRPTPPLATAVADALKQTR